MDSYTECTQYVSMSSCHCQCLRFQHVGSEEWGFSGAGETEAPVSLKDSSRGEAVLEGNSFAPLYSGEIERGDGHSSHREDSHREDRSGMTVIVRSRLGGE